MTYQPHFKWLFSWIWIILCYYGIDRGQIMPKGATVVQIMMTKYGFQWWGGTMQIIWRAIKMLYDMWRAPNTLLGLSCQSHGRWKATAVKMENMLWRKCGCQKDQRLSSQRRFVSSKYSKKELKSTTKVLREMPHIEYTSPCVLHKFGKIQKTSL